MIRENKYTCDSYTRNSPFTDKRLFTPCHPQISRYLSQL